MHTWRWWNRYCDVSIQIWLDDWKGRGSKKIYGAYLRERIRRESRVPTEETYQSFWCFQKLKSVYPAFGVNFCERLGNDMSLATSTLDSSHPDIFQIGCHCGNCQEPVCIPSKRALSRVCLSHPTLCFKRHATCRCFLDPKQVCSHHR